MIKKIQIELIILVFLLINILFSYSVDVGFYNYFAQLDYGSNTIYLKEFFVAITELGTSLWYFIIFILIYFLSFYGNKTKSNSIINKNYLKNLSLYSFSYLLTVGLVTQILKHLIGRARPNHTNFNEAIEYNFFSLDSTFHSFPSGHSSTIIAVTLIACSILPSLSIFFYFCGFLIALSRVVVGAHFITDVVAGALIAIIIFKIINMYFEKKHLNLMSKNFKIKDTSVLIKSIVVFFVLAVFSTIGFSLDIYFSGLFYFGNSQFLLQSYDFISIFFRKILLPFLLVYVFVLPVLGRFISMQYIFFGNKFSVKELFFIWISGIITLAVLVNVVLKDMWGRVRPNDILQFGGKDIFTPWYKIGDSCISNCSFVSGDASVGFALVLFYFLTGKNIYCYLALFLGVLLGLVRIIAGGHFFSDIIFSQLIVTTSIALFFFIYKKLYDK